MSFSLILLGLFIINCIGKRSIYDILSVNKPDLMISQIDIIFENDYSSYTIMVDNMEYIESGTTSFRNNGDWETLKIFKTYNESGADPFGIYNEFGVVYTDKNDYQYITKFLIYMENPNIIVFKQSFPNGTINSMDNYTHDGVISSFPSFKLQSINNNNLGFVHFGGYMCAGVGNQIGLFNQQNRNLYGGIQDSGPLALFNGTNTIVISSLDNHMSLSDNVTTTSDNIKEIRYGVQANVDNIPPEFEASFVLIATRNGGGVNEGMRNWGDKMLGYYGKERGNSHARDYTLQYLGYSTDNGAYYYYYTEPNKNYQDTVIDIKKYHDSNKIPTKYILLDSWWYYKGVNGGIKNWTARDDVFPNGLQYIYEETKWKIQAHNRYWSLDNVYANNIPQPTPQPTPLPSVYPKFEFTYSETDALPMSGEFWDYFFDINMDWGLIVYEQDWLSESDTTVPLVLNSTSFGREWLLQMNNGAVTHNLCIQYCMSYTRNILTTIELDGVTQARASDDYHPGNNQYRIGISSILASSIDIAPSKDSYWTKPITQTGPYNPNATEPYNRLQSVVLSLSKGPIAFSDQIGYTDRDLLMSCCNDDGLILTPDESATMIDSYFYQYSGLKVNGNIPGPSGEVSATFVNIGQNQIFRYLYVLSVNLITDYVLTRNDLDYYIKDNDDTLAWLAYEANATTTYYEFNSNNPVNLSKSDKYSFEYYTFIPINPMALNAFYLQGELSKWIRVSKKRFININTIDSDGSIKVTLKGAINEEVNVAFVKPSTKQQIIVKCVINESYTAVITCITSQNACKCA